MAILDVRVLRKLRITEAKSDKGTVQLTATQDLLVLCDGPPVFADIANDDTVWPKIPGKIPQINDYNIFGGFPLYVTNRQFEWLDEENEFLIKVTITYNAKAAEDPGGDGGGEGGSPQGGEPDTWKRMSITTQSASVPLTDEGADGQKGSKPAVNSAGDPVDGLTEDRALVKMTYTNTKVLRPNFRALLSYVNKTNEGEFLGSPERTIRCMGFNGEFDDKNQLWTISVEFLYDPHEWIVKYWDAGFNEIVDGKRRAILDIQGNPVSKPVPLDGAGRAVDPAMIGLGSQSGDTTELIAYPYFSANLSNLFRECNI